jgi:hypothetical protein
MSLAFLFHYLMLNMFRMLIHPSAGVCGLFVELFHGLYCSLRIEVFALAYLLSGECGCFRKLSKTTTHVTNIHSLNKYATNAKTTILTEQYNP